MGAPGADLGAHGSLSGWFGKALVWGSLGMLSGRMCSDRCGKGIDAKNVKTWTWGNVGSENQKVLLQAPGPIKMDPA